MSKDIFVGGPMMHAVEDAAGYHIPTRQMIESVLTALDTAGFRVLSAHRTERWGKVDTSAEYFAVCQRDFAWMTRAEAFIAILPPGGAGEPMRSDGTCVELGWASALAKPIVIVRQLSDRHSHLLRGLPKIAKAIEVDYCELRENPSAIVAAVEEVLDLARKKIAGV